MDPPPRALAAENPPPEQTLTARNKRPRMAELRTFSQSTAGGLAVKEFLDLREKEVAK